MTNRSDTVIVLGLVLGVLRGIATLGFYALIGYVIYHFVTKLW